MGKKLDELSDYVEALIDARVRWSQSPEGVKKLGPGSPSVPGLQDMHLILNMIRHLQVRRS